MMAMSALSGPTRRHHADDGGKQARSPRRARRKPLKPLRAGMPGVPVYLWRLTRMLSLLHARLRVQRAPGIPRALISDGAKRSRIIRAYRAAGSRRYVLTSLRASRSNPLLLPFCLMESSLSLAMTVGWPKPTGRANPRWRAPRQTIPPPSFRVRRFASSRNYGSSTGYPLTS